MCIDDRCVLCDSGVVEDLVHFLSVRVQGGQEVVVCGC